MRTEILRIHVYNTTAAMSLISIQLAVRVFVYICTHDYYNNLYMHLRLFQTELILCSKRAL